MIVLRDVHTIRLGLWYTCHFIRFEHVLKFKRWRGHSIEGLTYDLVDLTLIHKLMVGVYGGVNGHQLLPLIPSGLVKTLGKGLGIRCLCIMVLALWFSVASAHLENGDNPINSQVRLNQLCVKCICFIGSFMAWSCFSCHCWFVCM